MKICFLAPANNYHTKKWCEYFTNNGYDVNVISFTDGKIDNVNVHYINCGVKTTDSDLKKIKYLFKTKQVKKIVNEINPDIINAHYATSYGMVAARCKFKKYILSVWGKDVYTFPKKSIIHKKYFKYILKKAPYIFSTSEAMKEEVNKYINKDVFVTYFGVKMDLFKPRKKSKVFTVGTVKSLKDKYGIKNIIEAIEIINKERPDINIKCRIAGNGEKEEEYKKYANYKDVNIEWLGFISQEEASKVWANMNVAVFPSSISESFGVSAVEAQACETPVIVSNVPGLLESTNEKSRIVLKENNSKELADAIINLYENPKLREQMGKHGREYVLKKFEYNKCFKHIENLFIEISKR